jgi:NAD+ diphosphatase
MIGFRVAAADDTVMVDGEELVEARWFTRADLLEHRASGRRLGRVDSIDSFLLRSSLDEQVPSG